MAKEAHFIVMINENGEANIEYEISMNFDCGEVWDTIKETWFERNDNQVSSEYERAELLLLSLVKQTWKEN